MAARLIQIVRAYDFAARHHVDQRRKGAKGEPYINHLTEVAALVAESTGGADANQICAAVLHDTIEDTLATYDDLVASFSADVADLVREVTDDKSIPKHDRKRLQIEHAAHISARAKVIKIADKTSNLRSIQHSPPHWPLARKRRYFAWARAVVDAARGVNPAIEAAFDREYEAALSAGLAERGFVWRPEMETEGDD